MQKTISILMLVLFTFLLTFPVLAQTEEISSPSAEYVLPYPGLLPDHPLYGLKVLRDRLMLFLIRDPYKKAAMHLQLADKKLFAALKLAEKDNISLAQQTAKEGETHVNQMLAELNRGKDKGKKMDVSLINRALRATKKHQELLAGIKSRAKGPEKGYFDNLAQESRNNLKALLKLSQPQEIQ